MIAATNPPDALPEALESASVSTLAAPEGSVLSIPFRRPEESDWPWNRAINPTAAMIMGKTARNHQNDTPAAISVMRSRLAFPAALLTLALHPRAGTSAGDPMLASLVDGAGRPISPPPVRDIIPVAARPPTSAGPIPGS